LVATVAFSPSRPANHVSTSETEYDSSCSVRTGKASRKTAFRGERSRAAAGPAATLCIVRTHSLCPWVRSRNTFRLQQVDGDFEPVKTSFDHRSIVGSRRDHAHSHAVNSTQQRRTAEGVRNPPLDGPVEFFQVATVRHEI